MSTYLARVVWQTNNGQPTGEFAVRLPDNWAEMNELDQHNWLSDLESETFFEVMSVTARPIEETPARAGGGGNGAVCRELMWACHNLVAHPFAEVTHWLGFLCPPLRRLGLRLHDVTVPNHEPGTGRG